jgi:hypothetical protein
MEIIKPVAPALAGARLFLWAVTPRGSRALPAETSGVSGQSEQSLFFAPKPPKGGLNPSQDYARRFLF